MHLLSENLRRLRNQKGKVCPLELLEEHLNALFSVTVEKTTHLNALRKVTSTGVIL